MKKLTIKISIGEEFAGRAEELGFDKLEEYEYEIKSFNTIGEREAYIQAIQDAAEKGIVEYYIERQDVDIEEDEQIKVVGHIVDVEASIIPPGLFNKLIGMETYRDTVLGEHLFSIEHIMEESNKYFTIEEKAVLNRIKDAMEAEDSVYFRIVTN